jgi:hypothetical protein
MDILELIGEDGNGKDIGKEMKDGGKADTEGLKEILDLPGLLLQHLMEAGTKETALLTAGSCCCKSQAAGRIVHRAKGKGHRA